MDATGQTNSSSRTRRVGPRLAALLGLVAVSGLLPPEMPLGVHRAAAQRREPPAEAVDYYREGRDHYQSGRYREAADSLERALELDPGSVTLMYNLARVYELLGELTQAIDYYQRYLARLPSSETEERERIQSTLQRLEGAQANLEVAPPPPETPPEEPEDLVPRYVTTRGVADAPFWVTLTSGLTLLATGAVLGGFALREKNQHDDFVLGDDGPFSERQKLQDKAERMALTADIVLGVGVLTTLAAGLLYSLRSRTVELLPAGTRVDIDLGPGRAFLTLETRL